MLQNILLSLPKAAMPFSIMEKKLKYVLKGYVASRSTCV